MDNCGRSELSMCFDWELCCIEDTYFRVPVIGGGYYYGSFDADKLAETDVPRTSIDTPTFSE